MKRVVAIILVGILVLSMLLAMILQSGILNS